MTTRALAMTSTTMTIRLPIELHDKLAREFDEAALVRNNIPAGQLAGLVAQFGACAG